MPRGPRRDAPGCVQHVTCRGIEKRTIFLDDRDRERFLEVLEPILRESNTIGLAWALMPNHFHLVLRTTSDPLSRVMARLNTAYAVGFNLRHGRAGHLFQNRYHSKLVADGEYLRTVIRYVHCNPLAAGLVPDLASLERYPWTGHAETMGRAAQRILDVDAVLGAFGGNPVEARSRIRAWMATRDPELETSRPGIENLIRVVCQRFGISQVELLGRSREGRICAARSAIAHLACDEAGHSQASVARALGVCESSIHRARQRGRAALASLDSEKQG